MPRLDIKYPAADTPQPLGMTFHAHGTADPGTVTAEVQDTNGGFLKAGTSMSPPAGSTWAFEFLDVRATPANQDDDQIAVTHTNTGKDPGSVTQYFDIRITDSV